MTDWLRVLGYYFFIGLIIIGAVGGIWEVWSRRALKKFRLTDQQIKAIQDSQRGKRPLWNEPLELKRDKDR